MGRSGAPRRSQWETALAALFTVVACAGRSTHEGSAGGGGDSAAYGGAGAGSGGSTSTSAGGAGGTSTSNGGAGGTTRSAGGVGGGTASGGAGNANAGSGGNGALDDCEAISEQYSADVPQALACKRDQDCSFVVRALACGCQFYASDTSALDPLADEWSAEQCAEKYPLKCPACSALGDPRCDQTGYCTSGFGGQGGSAGTSGFGDAAGEAGAAGCSDSSGCASPRCDTLSQEYGDAFTQAQKCMPGVDSCSQQALSPTGCNCPAHVTDTTALDRIRAEQTRQHCPGLAPCPCAALAAPICGADGVCAAQ